MVEDEPTILTGLQGFRDVCPAPAQHRRQEHVGGPSLGSACRGLARGNMRCMAATTPFAIAHPVCNKRSNCPETDRAHESAQQPKGPHMLTTAVLKRLAISRGFIAVASGPALLIS